MKQNRRIIILTNVFFACLFLIGTFSWFIYQTSASKSMQTVQIKKHITSNDKRISIPSLKINNKIFTINNKKNLAKGVVQQYKNQRPSSNTNFILAGHNLVYQKKFFTNLPNAKPNMRIYLKYNGKQLIYVIDKAKYIQTKNKKYLQPNANYRKLTLYTCTDDSQQDKRFLVEGHLIKRERE